ncbi:MAG: hypothetical protein H0U72_06020 [Nitrosospira sp.]|nr:hypothetical protein [Nitrosospira sp.]
MKSLTMANRSRMAVLAVSSAMVMGAAAGGVNAQYGGAASGQGTSSSQSGAAGGSTSQANPKDSSGVAGHGILDKGVESGKVDQRIRVERNKGVEPSVPPPVHRNEKGKVTEDPSNMQGGSIGPN